MTPGSHGNCLMDPVPRSQWQLKTTQSIFARLKAAPEWFGTLALRFESIIQMNRAFAVNEPCVRCELTVEYLIYQEGTDFEVERGRLVVSIISGSV